MDKNIKECLDSDKNVGVKKDEKSISVKSILIVHGLIAALLLLFIRSMWFSASEIEGGLDSLGQAIAIAGMMRLSVLLFILNLIVFGVRMLTLKFGIKAKIIIYTVLSVICLGLSLYFLVNIIDCYEPIYGFNELETLVFMVLFVVFSIIAVFSVFSVVRVIRKMNPNSAEEEATK